MQVSEDLLQGMRGTEAPPRSGRPPDALVALLHGVGADANDLIGLAPELASAMPNAQFVSPNAPFAYDMAPFGRQWFSLQDRSEATILAGVERAAPLLATWLDRQRARLDLPWSRVGLLGFSQGTMMALHVAPRLPEPVAGVVGFSGRLIGAGRLAADALSRPPILLIHGSADPVVPATSLGHAERALAESGFVVHTELRPHLPHAIDAEGVELAVQFLASLLDG